MITMETITVKQISTSILDMYFQVLSMYKIFIIKWQERKLSMIKIFTFCFWPP